MMLVTLEEASNHLRRDATDDDADLTLKIHAASGAVFNYIKNSANATFLNSAGEIDFDSFGAPVGIPYEVMGATLLMIGYLYKQRDEDSTHEFETGYLPRPVTAMLYHYRIPTIA